MAGGRACSSSPSRWGPPARRAALLGAAGRPGVGHRRGVREGGHGRPWPSDGWLAACCCTGRCTPWWSAAWAAPFLLEAAFAAGPLAASQSALLIVDPMASIALGVELFGERLRAHAGGHRPAGDLPRRDVRRRRAPVGLGAPDDGGSHQGSAATGARCQGSCPSRVARRECPARTGRMRGVPGRGAAGHACPRSSDDRLPPPSLYRSSVACGNGPRQVRTISGPARRTPGNRTRTEGSGE